MPFIRGPGALSVTRSELSTKRVTARPLDIGTTSQASPRRSRLAHFGRLWPPQCVNHRPTQLPVNVIGSSVQTVGPGGGAMDWDPGNEQSSFSFDLNQSAAFAHAVT
jgi:hypothetical protein